MKKPPSKVAHNRPPIFFFCTGPAAQTAQKQKSRTPKSPLMQDWVFRLGQKPKLLLGTVQDKVWPLIRNTLIWFFWDHTRSWSKKYTQKGPSGVLSNFLLGCNFKKCISRECSVNFFKSPWQNLPCCLVVRWVLLLVLWTDWRRLYKTDLWISRWVRKSPKYFPNTNLT